MEGVLLLIGWWCVSPVVALLVFLLLRRTRWVSRSYKINAAIYLSILTILIISPFSEDIYINSIFSFGCHLNGGFLIKKEVKVDNFQANYSSVPFREVIDGSYRFIEFEVMDEKKSLGLEIGNYKVSLDGVEKGNCIKIYEELIKKIIYKENVLDMRKYLILLVGSILKTT